MKAINQILFEYKTHLITLNRQEFWKLNILPKSWNSSSNASTSSFDMWKEIGTKAWNQFWVQTSFWAMKGESELQNGSSMHHLVLNYDLEVTVKTDTASTS